MGLAIASDKTFNRIRERIAGSLLPDTCRIHAPSRNIGTAGTTGGATQGAPISYRGSIDIPCRLEASRHYRQGDVFMQETVISEFELYVPWDVEGPNHDYTIIMNNREYEFRKFMEDEGFRTTKGYLISEVRKGKGTASG